MKTAVVFFSLSLALAGCHRASPPRAPEKPAAQQGRGRVLFYRSPMNPAQTSPVPRQDEMGMDYLPVYEADVAAGRADVPGAPVPAGFAPITLDPQRQQALNLKTAVVHSGPFTGTIRTTGRVTYDETRVHHVHTRYEAYVERLHANFTGKYVRRGEPLASLYSPEVLAAEQEYLLVLRGRQPDLVRSARQRLLLWNISPADIDALEHSGEPQRTLNVYAPISGYVVQKTAVHGMRVRPEDSLFDIVDLSRVWVLADIYEYELPRVRVGQAGTVTLSYWRGRSWRGRLTYIFPAVDPKTRTVKARLEVDNPDADLKAEMFADVVIEVAPRRALLVPEEAVLETGTRKIVFVSPGDPPGRLQPREIRTGDRGGGCYEVRTGLAEGERVVLGAGFLLDSESRLQAALSALAPAPVQDGGAR